MDRAALHRVADAVDGRKALELLRQAVGRQNDVVHKVVFPPFTMSTFIPPLILAHALELKRQGEDPETALLLDRWRDVRPLARGINVLPFDE